MNKKGILLLKKKLGTALTAALLIAVVFYSAGCADKTTGLETRLPESFDIEGDVVSNISEDMDLSGAAGENVVEISDDAGAAGLEDKMVVISFENAGRANPFLPSWESKKLSQKPQKPLFKYELIEPPTTASPDNQASKIVTTKISGIMFDNYNPSAILNIEDSDYLVRSGDVINGYKILAISPSTVTIQLGKNVYKAGVGEVVTSGDVNYNTISNLSDKFGGNSGK